MKNPETGVLPAGTILPSSQGRFPPRLLTDARIRRVKCDETQPYCRRCTETGRKCEGPTGDRVRFVYDCPPTRKSSTGSRSPQVQVSLFAPQHGEDARRAFHYFTHHVIHLIAVPIDASFWKDLVLQLAHTHAFVWNSIVSISILHQHVPYLSLPSTWDPTTCATKVTNHEHRKALRFYNKAIADVRRLVDLGRMDTSTVALSYLMFASVEFGQRNVKTATELMRRCCSILTDNLTTSLHAKQNSTPTAQAVYQVITPNVLRKVVLGSILGNGPSPAQWVSQDQRSSKLLEAALSRSPWLRQARVQLHSLIFNCYEVIRVADFVADAKYDKDPGKAFFLSKRRSFLDELMQWKADFLESTVTNLAPSAEVEALSSYLLMYWAVCYIYLASCVSLGQMVFDEYMEQFVELLEHATIFLKHSIHSSYELRLLLSGFDPGVVQPLYFCGTKCRDPVLRRQALHLMRQAPQRGNLWAVVEPLRVIAKVIALEEGKNQIGCSSTAVRSPGSGNTGLPPEERRFAHVTVLSRQAPGGRQRQALELNRYEDRKDGSIKLITGYSWLEESEQEMQRDCSSEILHLDRQTDLPQARQVSSAPHLAWNLVTPPVQ